MSFRISALAAARLAALAALPLAVTAVSAAPADAVPAQRQSKPSSQAPGLHPALRQAKAQAAQLRAKARAERKRLGTQAGPEDDAPPALTAFSVEPQVNLRKTGEQALVNWTLADDLSGVAYMYVQFTGPGDSSAALSRSVGYTDVAWSDVQPLMLGASSPPGNWVATYLYAHDMRGNYVEYDAAALAALGNTVVKVGNKTFDQDPPALVGGEILTPTVTLSKNPPGMPYSFGDDLKVRVTASDAALGKIVSGVRYIYLYFCKWNADSCDYAVSLAATSDTWGDVQKTLVLGQRLVPGLEPGAYTLYQVYMQDNAGYWRDYTDVSHGGDTDFATFFPGGASFQVLP